ncbi:Lysine methyltransferase [Desulfotomaculum arcticum]|uniref:Lysine methyltransferase n=1 Tax=Desulfotruncus arcticus DSM 17038 TaxID=1121424 RepID=A0A1I2N0E0_9FIRM|nr:methyltransferase domain-containing protein [Desulfotruncus arcticus]SFF97222.1 Lysine methyltransferase [Desulfotomaculum arcticum] [Desulfotruncus arcticus DSM 17038]
METRETSFELPGHTINLTVVKNVEELITDPTDEDKVPCWAEIWPAARGLSHWIWDNLRFEGEELLELGTGLGLPGIVCGLKGAKVTFSDFNPLALELAGLNAARNGLKDFKTFLGDWRNFKIDRHFSWVMGSDIFYDPKLNVHLLNVIRQVVSKGGNLLIAHPNRPATFDFINELCATAKTDQRDFVMPIIIDDPYFPYYEIHVHHIKFRSQ